ncbi:YigZ family protein [Thalassotalea sp. HSM 43]|uniref:YigZ family protein n=1 Tax=Thalassotalea sp. HSM 43 TaxID=2552945 RepID=UPI001080B3CC|nr:YigZ family protein [Thalassotalea sp. HSM 43]QBY04428.1 YigZ family protein [Thalassotalea sp. HSM 43]
MSKTNITAKATPYLVPAEPLVFETEVLRSRFICAIARCNSAESAKAFIDSKRQQFPDASHNCYAFMHSRPEISTAYGFSDDGEPTGCAGKPMLAVLQGSDIGEICAVVTRYFGGTKLGTGGMQRAYANAVRQAINVLATELVTPRDTVTLQCDYGQLKDIEHVVAAFDGEILSKDYGVDISLSVAIPIPAIDAYCQRIVEITAGRVIPNNPLL